MYMACLYIVTYAFQLTKVKHRILYISIGIANSKFGILKKSHDLYYITYFILDGPPITLKSTIRKIYIE